MGKALVMVLVPQEVLQPIGEGEDAHYLVEVPVDAVWWPPAEPTTIEWWRDREARRVHGRAVRASLEMFLNCVLGGLYGRLRTGWWVLGRVRARVVECRPRPEYELAAFARAVRGGSRP